MDQIQAFYLTLPIYSSVQKFPSNILTNFTTKLPNSIFLDGVWEVGLAEILYPYTWNKIRSGRQGLRLEHGMKEIISL